MITTISKQLEDITTVGHITTVGGEIKGNNSYSRWNSKNECTWVKYNNPILNKNKKIYTGRKITDYFDEKVKYIYASHFLDLLYDCDITNRITIYDKRLKVNIPITTKTQLYMAAGFSSKCHGLKFVKYLLENEIVKETKIILSDKGKTKTTTNYYISPMITMDKYGIHPATWSVFREVLIPYLHRDTIDSLDKINAIYYSSDYEEESDRIKQIDKIIAAEEEKNNPKPPVLKKLNR